MLPNRRRLSWQAWPRSDTRAAGTRGQALRGHLVSWRLSAARFSIKCSARTAAVGAIDADMRRMVKASAACPRLITIPGVGHLTELAVTAEIDDPERFRRSREISAAPLAYPT